MVTQERAKTEAVEALQELGLKEYQARCLVALTRVETATAKEVSDISGVPRTRVYDAIDNLEALGLIATQHGSPKQFRAVDVEEATRILRRQKDDRIDSLETQLQSLEPPANDSTDALNQEVWAMSGAAAIQTRTEDDVAAADEEVVLLVVEESLLTDELLDRLRAAADRGVSVTIGGATPAITEGIRETLPDARVFETDLEWLLGPEGRDEVAVSRLLLTDGERLLVGSFYPDGDREAEQAVLAGGLENGVVVLLRRLLETGLQSAGSLEA